MLVVTPSTTHPPAYSLHKYWSRKPANVLAELVLALSPPSGLVVDPFCGSGVLLREAGIRGRSAIGFDVNPIALALSQATVSPPDPSVWRQAADKVTKVLSSRAVDAGYVTEDAGVIRYVVHEMVVNCRGCQSTVGTTGALRRGRRYLCPKCRNRLALNFSQMLCTRPTGCRVLSEANLRVNPALLSEQSRWSGIPTTPAPSRFDVPLIENNRTLVGPGMTTRSLFTPRNFALLTYAADLVWDVADPTIRGGLLLWLTSSVAQCSRLIADRQGLTTGGPAWTVPGFWIPPLHLETNPVMHLEARARRFERGLRELYVRRPTNAVQVDLRDAAEGLESVAQSARKADLLFLDPPYGDSVPFVEFSALWNGFLLEHPDPMSDMSVSDRRGQTSAWDDYHSRLATVVRSARAVLKDDGALVTTFNNKDRRAWLALLSAVQAVDLYCEDVWYQPAAVVSAKAQLSPKGSYTSDIYAIFRVRENFRPVGEWELIKPHLIRAAVVRGGTVPLTVAQRVLAVAWLQENLPAGDFDSAVSWMRRAFVRDGAYLRWLGPNLPVDITLEAAVATAMSENRRVGAGRGSSIYARVVQRVGGAQTPDPWEVKEVYSRLCLEERGAAGQLDLFGRADPSGVGGSGGRAGELKRTQKVAIRTREL